MPTAVVCLSGGMDSATVLAECVQKKGKDNVDAVCFAYGSKHGPYEIKASKQIAAYYGVRCDEFNIMPIFQGFQSHLLTSGGAIPEGHYHEESMRKTVVPGRNLIFISILAGWAASIGKAEVWLGIHSGDHFIYPDCRPAFFLAAQQAVYEGSGQQVALVAPFLYGDKISIISRGRILGVPYELTRTCYTESDVACGRCGSCQERLEAFKVNGITDPIEYQTRELAPKSKE